MTQMFWSSPLFNICKICKTKDQIVDASNIKQGHYDITVKWNIDFKASKYILVKLP